MDIESGQVLCRRHYQPRITSPTRPVYLSSSTCPYESTTNSTISQKESRTKSKETREPESRLRASSITSGGSRKSKYSEKGTLIKSSLFDKIEQSQDKDYHHKLLKQKKEEGQHLQLTVSRLEARLYFLNEEADKYHENIISSSKKFRSLLIRYFTNKQ